MAEASGHEFPDYYFRKMRPWDLAPGSINVPMILWLYNLALGWDMHTYASQRYQMISHEGLWVPGRNGESARDFDFRDFLKRIPELNHEELVRILKAAHALLGSKADDIGQGCPGKK